MKKTKMNTKNFLVSFCAIAIALFLVATISATTTQIATVNSVKVNDLYDSGNEDISVVAGETVIVKVLFTSLETAANVKIKAGVEGTKIDTSATSQSFNVEAGKRYSKTLTFRIPYELKDDVSNNLALNIKLWNGDFKTEYPEITLRVQRPSYNADIMSISASKAADAGELVPVNVVLKNTGYNYLDDMYVTLKIPSLGIEKTSYFGDLYAVEDTSDDKDTTSKRFYVQIPFDAKAGIYDIEVEAKNNDLTVDSKTQIIINNDFTNDVIIGNSNKVVAVDQNAQFNLLLANPTNKLKVYRIVVESNGDLSADANQVLVAVPAGLTKNLIVNAKATSEGEYNFNVNIFSGEKLVRTVPLSVSVSGKTTSSPIVILTIILAIIFLVLLAVLIVLMKRKPEKTEESGESYY